MDLKQIEKLMAAMNRQGMKRLNIKQEGIEIELEKECQTTAYVSIPEIGMQHPMRQLPSLPQSEKIEAISETKEIKDAKYITSPMVGTFYAAPSPEDSPYVKVGDRSDESDERSERAACRYCGRNLSAQRRSCRIWHQNNAAKLMWQK